MTTDSNLPTVSSMWIGPALSFIEQLCLKSFVDNGHQTKLYVYDDVKNIPEGVEVCDANTIMPTNEFIINRDIGTAGPHADKFRYFMLRDTDEIWVDTDAYCHKPFPDTEYYFAKHFRDEINNGVLRLPKTSPTLKDLIEFCSDEYPKIPDDWWLPEPHKSAYERSLLENKPMHISEFRWETWGPDAIGYFLRKNGEDIYALDKNTLYPFSNQKVQKNILRPNAKPLNIPEETLSIHFYSSSLWNFFREGNKPRHQCLLMKLCRKHGIDPAAAPVF